MSFRWAFVFAVVILGSATFYEPLAQLLPEALVGLVQRNSEAYVFAVLMILDMEVVAPSGEPARRRWFLWLGVLGLAWMATYLGGETLGLSQQVITLNEAIGAVIVASVYLRWSRGPSRSLQPPLVRRQVIFYIAMLALPILGETLPRGPDDGIAMQIIDNAELFGFALLAAFLFDIVEKWPSGRWWRGWSRWAWYLILVLVPVLYTAYNPSHEELVEAVGFLDSGIAWLQRVTEAFVAVAIVSVFFDLRRRVSPSRDTKAV